MPGYLLMQVDVFTQRPLQGNACAVLLDADDLDQGSMLAIAREMNLSETAFVRRSSRADFGVRYFTPAEEIPMAGHPTLATIYALVQWGRIQLLEPLTAVSLELSAGLIQVEILSRAGCIERITMTQARPTFLGCYPADVIAPVFNLQPADFLPGVPIQTVSTGTPQLMLPLRDLEALRKARLDIAGYTRLRALSDFFSPHLFCLEGITPEGTTFARHLGAPPDLPEDPFTGSATGGMAAYLWRYRLIDKPTFIAQQGHWMNRPGEAQVEVIGAPEDILAVKVGGQAVAVMQGKLIIDRSCLDGTPANSNE